MEHEQTTCIRLAALTKTLPAFVGSLNLNHLLQNFGSVLLQGFQARPAALNALSPPVTRLAFLDAETVSPFDSVNNVGRMFEAGSGGSPVAPAPRLRTNL